MALVVQIASSLNGTAHDCLEYQGARHSGWHPHRTGRSWFSHPGRISTPKHVTGSLNFAHWCIWELLDAACLLACCTFLRLCVCVCVVGLSLYIIKSYPSIYSTYLSTYLPLPPSLPASVCLCLYVSLSLSLSLSLLPPSLHLRASVRTCEDMCVCVCVLRALSVCLLVSSLDGRECLALCVCGDLCMLVSATFSKTLLLCIAGEHYQIATSSDHFWPTTRQLKCPSIFDYHGYPVSHSMSQKCKTLKTNT